MRRDDAFYKMEKTMPELPEVETTRRGLQAVVVGQKIVGVEVRRYDLRQPIPRNLAKSLVGRRIVDVRRRAKYLLIDLDSGAVLLAHLGMSGSFSVRKSIHDPLKTHDHVVIVLENGMCAVFHDPRRFGVIDLFPRAEESAHPLLAHLGPEPLSEDFSAAYLRAQLARRKGPIKSVLMDQKLVVGVGNIYASESLFMAGIHPLLQSDKVISSTPKIITSIQATLTAAIASGGSTLRDFVGAGGEGGYFQHHFNVYDRAGDACFVCGDGIQTCVQAGRATYWCGTCQPLRKKRGNA